MSYKVIVAHPGKQHSFRLASALKKNGMLCKYVTTVYDKKNSFLMRVLKKFLDKGNLKRANSRKNPDLIDDDIIQFCEFSGFIEIILARYDKSKRLYNKWHSFTSDRFGKKVAALAMKEKVDAVIMYDTNALCCFEKLKKEAPGIKRIMDSSAANRLFMKTVYEKDMETCPIFSEKLKSEVNYLWNKKSMDRCVREIENTEYILAPSEFVKKSFLFSNIEEQKIKICPYGSNFEPISRIVENDCSKRPLEAVYVGNVTEMKGIYYLLEALRSISNDLVHLTVIGAYDNSAHIFDKYIGQVTFTGRIQHDEVKNMLCASDVFVFASLGEGLSLSVLEALACGLPCIVTEHSGANDAIEDYKNGFVIPIQNIKAIQDSLLWFVNNRERIPEMKQRAIETAGKYTWETYEERVSSSIIQIIDGEQ